jgi:hypothetical protein
VGMGIMRIMQLSGLRDTMFALCRSVGARVG